MRICPLRLHALICISSIILVLDQANLESLPRHVPNYLRAAVGPPSSVARRHFCTVCGFSSNYTCVRCGTRFCSTRCQNIHNDTRCLKFVAWYVNSCTSLDLCYSLLVANFYMYFLNFNAVDYTISSTSGAMFFTSEPSMFNFALTCVIPLSTRVPNVLNARLVSWARVNCK